MVLVTNYLGKVAWEVLLTPVTYRIVAFKRAEGVDVFDRGTDYAPWRVGVLGRDRAASNLLHLRWCFDRHDWATCVAESPTKAPLVTSDHVTCYGMVRHG